MRVTIIFDNFGPYHLARVAAASKFFDVVGIELRAKSVTYEWVRKDNRNFPIHTLPSSKTGNKAPRIALLPLMEDALAETAPDVVAVNGWGDFMAPQSIRWCVRHDIPIVLLSESSALDGPSSVLKTSVKQRMIRLAASALVGGIPHRNHVAGLGLAAARIFTGYNAVDNAHFAAESEKCREVSCREEGALEKKCAELTRTETPGEAVWRETRQPQFSIHNPQSTIFPYFLASNRFIERKNLTRLIEAYAQYAESFKCSVSSVQCREDQRMPDNGQSTSDPWNLCLLGDGELREKLIAQCHALGLDVIGSAPWESDRNTETQRHRNTVFFPGFRQIDELPRFYAHAGCFIHPALTEPWGLVVNEAMACGLPVLVSERVGCAQDLVQGGVNGFTFDPESVEQICNLMSTVSAPNFPRNEFGSASRCLVDKYSPDAFAAGLEAAARKALEIGPAKPSLLDRALLEILCRIR